MDLTVSWLNRLVFMKFRLLSPKTYSKLVTLPILVPAVCVHGIAHTPQVQNYAAKHRLRTPKLSLLTSVKHVQHSLMMDRKRSETCRCDF